MNEVCLYYALSISTGKKLNIRFGLFPIQVMQACDIDNTLFHTGSQPAFKSVAALTCLTFKKQIQAQVYLICGQHSSYLARKVNLQLGRTRGSNDQGGINGSVEPFMGVYLFKHPGQLEPFCMEFTSSPFPPSTLAFSYSPKISLLG